MTYKKFKKKVARFGLLYAGMILLMLGIMTALSDNGGELITVIGIVMSVTGFLILAIIFSSE